MGIHVKGIIQYMVHMGDVHDQNFFGVIQNLEIMSYSEQHISKNGFQKYSMERKIVPVHSAPVVILGAGKETKNTTILLH